MRACQLATRLSAVVLSIAMFGCASTPQFSDGNLVRVGYAIADTLVKNASLSLGGQDPIIVASLVNVNNLEQSSSFGRMISEHIASRLAQHGKRVIEVKLRHESIFVNNERSNGEFMLSRNVREISKSHNAAAVVVGTYANGGDRVYISARMVSPTDNLIVSTSDVAVPMYRDTLNALLQSY
jgi:TolB-like protein